MTATAALTKEQIRGVLKDVHGILPDRGLTKAQLQHLLDEAEAGLIPEETPEVVEGEAVEIEEEPTPEQAEAVESMELAVREEREHPQHPVAVLPSAGEWEATMTMATTIASTPFVPEAYRGQPEAVVAAILYGREIGIGPMQALRQIHMIDGKPSLSAELMMAQMRRGGLVVLASDSTRERAYIKARRSDTGEQAEVEWTIEEARGIPARERGQNITLAEKSTWRSYPADMLWARAVGRLARRLGSDLLGGMVYASEEMADWDEGDYGGTGYATGAAPAAEAAPAGPQPSTSKGVEARADAPRSWTQIKEILDGIDATGGSGWPTWIEQAINALTGKHRTQELTPGEEMRDTLILIANGVANLAETMAGREFPPPTRKEVQDAFAHANSVDHRLLGPDGPMDPDEAAMMQAAAEARAAKTAEPAQDDAEQPADAQTADEAAPGQPESGESLSGPLAEADEADLPEFGEESNGDSEPTGT